MGNGERIKMSPAQVREDLSAGTKDAAEKGRVPELTPTELDLLYEIVVDKNRVVGVEPGEEVVFSDDVTTIRMSDDEGAGGGIGLPMSRTLSTLVHERAFAQDSALMVTAAGANVPETKAELNTEMQAIETTQLLLTVPLLYLSGAFLLWYFEPIGPYGNPSELLPQGKIQEARDAQEEAASKASEDLVYIGKSLASAGLDCLNLDTTAASGDAEFYAALKATQKLKEIVPEMAIEMGMAGEFIIGVHGQMVFNGQRLAGMFPHEQVKVAEAAGVDIFGPVINTNCSQSFPWNIARTVTFVKHTSAVSSIPVHPNAGMGVGGVPMHPTPPIDCVSRVAKAMVQIGKADGL
jgi:dimethylamine--corrinoid protein Co-methyltransferase